MRKSVIQGTGMGLFSAIMSLTALRSFPTPDLPLDMVAGETASQVPTNTVRPGSGRTPSHLPPNPGRSPLYLCYVSRY
ncbi:hypothetical protein GE09DRAFT_76320 [Coniochaeta sp. 2T2.1]|nr:hypothetical protein GE09DRAFT_76320 [Coniochaeta sp. 2T2.1]